MSEVIRILQGSPQLGAHDRVTMLHDFATDDVRDQVERRKGDGQRVYNYTERRLLWALLQSDAEDWPEGWPTAVGWARLVKIRSGEAAEQLPWLEKKGQVVGTWDPEVEDYRYAPAGAL